MKTEGEKLNFELVLEISKTDPRRIIYVEPGSRLVPNEKEGVGEYITVDYLITLTGEKTIDRLDDIWKWKGKEGTSFYNANQSPEDFFAGNCPIYISSETEENREKRTKQLVKKMVAKDNERKWQLVVSNRGKVTEGMDHTNIEDNSELIRRLHLYEKFIGKLNAQKLQEASTKDLALALLNARKYAQFPIDY